MNMITALESLWKSWLPLCLNVQSRIITYRGWKIGIRTQHRGWGGCVARLCWPAARDKSLTWLYVVYWYFKKMMNGHTQHAKLMGLGPQHTQL